MNALVAVLGPELEATLALNTPILALAHELRACPQVLTAAASGASRRPTRRIC